MVTPGPEHDTGCAEVRRRAVGARGGALFAVFLDAAGEVALVVEPQEGTDHVDELFLRDLTGLVVDVSLHALLLVVWRPSGRPAPVDRRLWREMTQRLAGGSTSFVDLLVVGDSLSWSAVRAARHAPTSRRAG